MDTNDKVVRVDNHKLMAFIGLCRRHDLTYQYSDDHGAWRRGKSSEAMIRALARELPPGEAARIWNKMVDGCVVEDSRAQFYWRE